VAFHGSHHEERPKRGGGKEQQRGGLVFICQVMTASGPRTNEPKQLYLHEHRLCPLFGLYCGCIGSRWTRDRQPLCPFVRIMPWLYWISLDTRQLLCPLVRFMQRLYWVSLDTRQTATVSACSDYAVAVLGLTGYETDRTTNRHTDVT
jgi:hypothetical protein